MSTNTIETLRFNCTTCPSECLLTVEVERDADGAVVEVRSVTTSEAIPLALHAQAMNFIRGLVVNAPIRMGDVVLENLLNTNINLIASMDIDRAQVAN